LSQKLLRDSRLYETLLRIDEDVAREARAKGCACGGRLHQADYPRKPRGGPDDLRGYDRRRSFCCDREGCRKRRTPPSVRFLGRKVYLGVVVVLTMALRDALTPRRVATLREHLEVSLRTLKRWRRWWREVFPRSSFWKAARGRLSPPVEVAKLPSSLLVRFGFRPSRRRTVTCLEFLAPITTMSYG